MRGSHGWRGIRNHIDLVPRDALEEAQSETAEADQARYRGATASAMERAGWHLPRTLRNALGTLALVELMGRHATRMITTEATWASHVKELEAVGVDIKIGRRKMAP